MKSAMLLLCCVVVIGLAFAAPPDEKPKLRPTQIDVLSDTEGVDFGPYLQEIIPTIRKNWFLLIPDTAQTKKGKIAIEFTISKDGHLKDMRLVARTNDLALDRPAWGSITSSDPFPPLPKDFKGSSLVLRLRFYYNPDKEDTAPPKPNQ